MLEHERIVIFSIFIGRSKEGDCFYLFNIVRELLVCDEIFRKKLNGWICDLTPSKIVGIKQGL